MKCLKYANPESEIRLVVTKSWGFPGGSVVKNPLSDGGDTGDKGLILGSRRSGGVHGNTLQYSYLENPMDRGAWWPRVHGVAKEPDTT